MRILYVWGLWRIKEVINFFMIFDTNQEWEFITDMIHSQPIGDVCLRKKNILFVMQILLERISRMLDKKERCISKRAYLRLKNSFQI